MACQSKNYSSLIFADSEVYINYLALIVDIM